MTRYRPWLDPKKKPVRARGYVTCPQCGKVGYPSKATAKQMGRLRYQGVQMRAYKCGSLWHLTSQATDAVTFYRERPGQRTGDA